MRDVVRATFRAFTAPLEGVVSWMYLDIKGLVTTGIGNLIDPAQHALRLPWVLKDTGTPASQSSIAADWMNVKGRPVLAQQGYRAAEQYTRCRLTDEGIDQLVLGKLDEFAGVLAGRFPNFDLWPADAQLGALSMAWACGPAFRFPAWEAAANAGDWATAARECTINEKGNPGLIPRNRANRILFGNAALAADPAVLYWPTVLSDDEPTQPGA